MRRGSWYISSSSVLRSLFLPFIHPFDLWAFFSFLFSLLFSSLLSLSLSLLLGQRTVVTPAACLTMNSNYNPHIHTQVAHTETADGVKHKPRDRK